MDVRTCVGVGNASARGGKVASRFFSRARGGLNFLPPSRERARENNNNKKKKSRGREVECENCALEFARGTVCACVCIGVY